MDEVLQEKLNKKFAASNINFEIINTGTSSYSTLIYYLLIKNYLIEYQPDMIFLNIDMTDIPNDSFYRNFLIKNSEGEILAITPQDNTKNIKYQLTPNGYKKIKINNYIINNKIELIFYLTLNIFNFFLNYLIKIFFYFFLLNFLKLTQTSSTKL